MRRVLFVDDEPLVLEGLQNLLRKERKVWDMAFLPGGEAAVRLLAERPFDVIVTDMRMPGMDGAALLDHVYCNYPGIVRIVLSGHTETEVALRTVPVAHQFLHKPCDASALRNAVERACRLQAQLNEPTLKQFAGEMRGLPSTPRSYLALTRALANPDTSLQDVAGIVAQDVGMCAKVLQIVNSAFFAFPQRIRSVQHAVTLLGLNTLKSLALCVETFRAFEGSELDAGELEKLQEQALLSAGIARQIIRDKHAADDAFMAAMVHDVGQLVMMSRMPARYAELRAAATEANEPPYVAERKALGFTHCDVGAYLLGIWGLPYPIVEAVAHHHEPAQVRHEHFELLDAVHVASVLAVEALGGVGGPAGLDVKHLRTLGVDAELTGWRKVATRLAGAEA